MSAQVSAQTHLSRVERAAVNRLVVGSNPTAGANSRTDNDEANPVSSRVAPSLSPCVSAQVNPRWLWAHVDRPDLFGCWTWIGHVNHQGYGEYFQGALRLLAHRAVWTLVNGPIPAGQIIRHDCDNTRCVNPAHLRIGTHADNVADKVARGRQARGEGNGRAVLGVDDVRAIRAAHDAGASLTELHERYPSVTRRAIRFIVERVNWRHVA